LKRHQRRHGSPVVYGTPLWIMRRLGLFDLDPCANPARLLPMVGSYYTETDDGLAMPWRGRVWLNPPFDQVRRPQFMARMAEHRHGIMLIPAAFETEAFKTHVIRQCAAVLTLDVRPHFINAQGKRSRHNSGATMCLVAYDVKDIDVLADSNLGTVWYAQPRRSGGDLI
jgi:hypothetical protein